jgi:uncharacterized protein
VHPSSGYVVFLVLFIVQAWISATLWQSAGRRTRGRGLIAARCAIAVFHAAVLACYWLSSSDFVARLGIQAPVVIVLGAVALAYTAIASVLMVVVLTGRRLGRHLNADADPARRRVLRLAGGAAVASPVAALAWGTLVERTSFRVRELEIPLPGLPQDLDGLRILQLSDIHLSMFLSESDFARVVDASRELRPNLAVITGDLISEQGDPLDACIRQLGRLRADAGVFACMGNHEAYAKAQSYTEMEAAKYGIRYLRGAASPLRFGGAVLNLAGVDYQPMTEKPRYLHGAGRLIVPAACNLLLSHNPDVFPAAVRQGWNCVLAGHTHGGQITVEILDQAITPIRVFTRYVRGLYRLGHSAAYVTRGIGSIGIPARLGAPPEISLLRLRKA